MEFKENLKQLRIQKGLTQAQLAEKLFVSRSTVAKWENGLGLPNPESMAALEKIFDIVAEELATKEPEMVIVKENRKLRWIGQIIGWSAIFVLLIIITAVIESSDSKVDIAKKLNLGVGEVSLVIGLYKGEEE